MHYKYRIQTSPFDFKNYVLNYTENYDLITQRRNFLFISVDLKACVHPVIILLMLSLSYSQLNSQTLNVSTNKRNNKLEMNSMAIFFQL